MQLMQCYYVHHTGQIKNKKNTMQSSIHMHTKNWTCWTVQTHLLLQQVVSRPESHPQLCVGHAHMWMVQGASNSVSHRHVVTLHHNSMRLAKRCKLTRLPASASLAPSSLLTTLPPTSPVPMEAARATAGLEGPLDDAPLELLAFADYPGPASGNACRIATICSNSLSESFLALDFKR